MLARLGMAIVRQKVVLLDINRARSALSDDGGRLHAKAIAVAVGCRRVFQQVGTVLNSFNVLNGLITSSPIEEILSTILLCV